MAHHIERERERERKREQWNIEPQTVISGTCAIEADAIGVGSIYSYTLSIGLPNSSRMIL